MVTAEVTARPCMSKTTYKHHCLQGAEYKMVQSKRELGTPLSRIMDSIM